MSLADYLAKNYLTADSEKKSKKRKRKQKDGLVIKDDDNLGWKDKDDDDDDDAPMIGTDHLKLEINDLSNKFISRRRLAQEQKEIQRLSYCLDKRWHSSTFTCRTTRRRHRSCGCNHSANCCR